MMTGFTAVSMNTFGIKVIVLASAVVAVALVLGFLSERGFITALVGGIILACSFFGLWRPNSPASASINKSPQPHKT